MVISREVSGFSTDEQGQFTWSTGNHYNTTLSMRQMVDDNARRTLPMS